MPNLTNAEYLLKLAKAHASNDEDEDASNDEDEDATDLEERLDNCLKRC